eukprot:TCONS_00035734-protein
MGKTKFKASWKQDRPWLVEVKNNVHEALCTVCGDKLNITSGIGAVKSHETRPKHLSNLQSHSRQSTFIRKDEKGTLTLKSPSGEYQLTSEEQKWKAEILHSLNVVDKNFSFSSCSSDNYLNREKFPDSDIAKAYEMSSTKVAYLIKFGIAKYFQDELLKEVHDQPFTFHFDESTTSQTKKQYDGYVRFYSFTSGEVVVAYCGTLFVGRCKANDLLDHLHIFFKKNNLNVNMLLNLGLDGPNVNLAFMELLKKSITFIDIGTCALHVCNNAFGRLVKELNCIVELDQMAIDFHFFFKYSAGRREDYSKVTELTGVLTQHLEKHCASRWISLDRVLIKLIEQFLNLKNYFMKKVPELPGFKGKSGIAATSRYKRIKQYLTDERVLIVMHFVASVAQDFQAFIKPLQTKSPMIHILHSKCTKLIHTLLRRFILENKISNSKTKKPIGTNKLLDLEVKDSTNQTVRRIIKIFAPF